jgi:hypothetical protein
MRYQHQHPLRPPYPIHIREPDNYCLFFFDPYERDPHILKVLHITLLPTQTMDSLNLSSEKKQFFSDRKAAQADRLFNLDNRDTLKSHLSDQATAVPVLQKVLNDILRCHSLESFHGSDNGKKLWISVWEQYWNLLSFLIKDEIQLIIDELDAKIHSKINEATTAFLASPATSHLHTVIPLRNFLQEILRVFSTLSSTYVSWNDSRRIFSQLSDFYSIFARTHFYNGGLKAHADKLSKLISQNIEAFDYLEIQVFDMGTAFLATHDGTASSAETVSDDGDSEISETLASASPRRAQSFDDLYNAPPIISRSSYRQEQPQLAAADFVLVQNDIIEPESKHAKLNSDEHRNNFIPVFSEWMAQVDRYASLYKKIIQKCLQLSIEEFTQNDNYFSMASRSISSMWFFKPSTSSTDIAAIQQKLEQTTTLSSAIIAAFEMTKKDDSATKAILLRFIGMLLYLCISEKYVFDFFCTDLTKENIEKSLILISAPIVTEAETKAFADQFLNEACQARLD